MMSRLTLSRTIVLTRLAVATVMLSNVGFGGCCVGDESNSYGFSWSWGGNTIGMVEFHRARMWPMPSENPRSIFVILPTGDVPPAEAIEVLQDGVDLGLVGTLHRHETVTAGGCPRDWLDYDLRALPPGEYTVVHRRSAESPNTESPHRGWTTFDGEAALVTTFVIDARFVPDAGSGDAGP